MHKIYENNDLMMYARKRYCHYCGRPLSHRRCERIVRKSDPDHRKYCSSFGVRPFVFVGKYRLHGDLRVIGTEYYCEHCDKSFSCDEQGEIKNAQNYFVRHVVSKEEVDYVVKGKYIPLEKQNQLINKEDVFTNILERYKPLLWIPILGCFVFWNKIPRQIIDQTTITKTRRKSFVLSFFALLLVSAIFIGVGSVFSRLETFARIGTVIGISLSTILYNETSLLCVNQKIKELSKRIRR